MQPDSPLVGAGAPRRCGFCENGRVHRRSRRRRGVITAVVVLTVVAALGLAAGLIIPPVWAAASTTVAVDDTTMTLHDGGATASITVPRGWATRPAFADSSRVTLFSPDSVLRIDLAVMRSSDPRAAVRSVAPGAIDTIDTEPDGDGRELLHARTRDGATVVGAVAGTGVVLTFVGEPSPSYDAELASLVAGMSVTP